jgi:hypothetical protein
MALPEPEATPTPAPCGAAGLRGIWRDFVTSGLDGDVYSSAMRRVRFLNVFALVTIVALLAFGVYNVVSGSSTARPLVGLVEMIAALLGSLILLHLRIGRNVGQAQDLTMTLTLAVMTFLLYTGGMERTGIFWWFCFPAGAFYLKGLRGGWWWAVFPIRSSRSASSSLRIWW